MTLPRLAERGIEPWLNAVVGASKIALALGFLVLGVVGLAGLGN